MANIIRVKLPDGVHRFKPFTVADYRDFLLIRNDIVTNLEEQTEIVDELLEELYPSYDAGVRGYIFMKVLTSSIGKTLLPLQYECRQCGKKHRIMLNLSSKELKKPTIEVDNIKLNFKYPHKITDDYADVFLKSIDSIEHEGQEYKWASLDEDTKTQIVDVITYDKFEEILTKLRSININQTIRCCKNTELQIHSPLDLFKLMFSPDEIFIFYRTNRLLNKSEYAMSDIMNMMPIERNIALGLLEKEVQK